MHLESKTENRIRIHARVCFLQRFKNVLLKIFHQTMRIPITKRSIYDFIVSSFFFFEVVKPQPMCGSPIGFQFYTLGTRGTFKVDFVGGKKIKFVIKNLWNLKTSLP